MKKAGMIMRKNKVLRWALLLCICFTCTIGYLGLQASAAAAEIIDCDLPSEYGLGDSFVMPEGKVSYKDQDKAPDTKYVVFPSGKAVAGETIVLSEAGKYELVFKAKFDGVSVTAKKSFVVKKTLLQVNNDNSSAQIVDGKIKVSLAPDDVFTYNAVLDLNAATKGIPFLEMEMNPSVIGTADVTRLKIRLTDLYDEENYVTISLNHFTDAWASGHIYMTGGAAFQPQVGIENSGNPAGKKVFTNDTFGYGAAVNFPMSGLPKSPMDSVLSLYFDYAERSMYADRESYSGMNQLLFDLDDPFLFGDDIWHGFTTGEVRMSIFATNYQAATCNFTISTINGNSEFVDNGDVNAPSISVNTGYQADNLPTALVGKRYPVFEAAAIDGHDGKIPAVASVYYRYYSEKPVEVAVNDGSFIPPKEGVYVIEYMAEDTSGNIGTKCVKVNAVKGEGLQVTLQDMAAEADTGTTVKVISAIDCTDASGNVTYSVKAKHLATAEEIEIDPQTLSFIPMTDGEWEITVTVKDYISTVIKTFTLNANHTTQPQVYSTVGVPRYFILGAAYELPVLQGYDFSSGQGVLTNMDVFVTESGREEKAVENGKYIPENAGNVKITYRLSVDGNVCEKAYDATVVDVGYTGDLDLSKYFVVSKGAATAQMDNASIIYEVKNNATFDFVNFVQVKNFTFSFQAGEINTYKKVNIYLTDIVSGKQVKVSYIRTADGAAFSVNDGVDTKLASSFDGINKNFSLEFSNDTCMVSPEAGIELEVKKFLDGSDFTGFTGSVARFSVELDGVSGASQIVMKNLNSQTLNNAKVDRFTPQIIVETMSGDRGEGDRLTLTGAFAYDVLDPIAVMTLDVTDPNGAYVTDDNGVVLDGSQDATKDYTIIINDLGDYVIRYVIKDGKGKTDTYVYAITAKDVEAPTITLQKHKESAKAGDTVTLATAEVSDNLTEACTVVAYVFDPEGENVKVTDGKFEAATSGLYSVRYMAFDADGNYAFVSYEIQVK